MRLEPGPEYPKSMYQDGGDALIWGKPVQTRIVHSGDEETEALADGWRLSPVSSDLEESAAEPPRRGRPPKEKAE